MKIHRVTVFALMLSASLAPQTGALPIDLFTTGQSVTVSGPPVGFKSEFGSAIAGEAIGSERDIYVERTAANSGTISVNVAGSISGVASYNSGIRTTGRGLIVWDGIDGNVAVNATGLGGTDLTAGGANTAFRISRASDLGGTITITVYQDETHVSQASIAVPADPTLTLIPVDIFFSAFVAIGSEGGASFANVGAISLLMDGSVAGADMGVGAFETVSFNNAPAADAGADQNTCDDIDFVILPGAGSDPDGDAIGFSWRQIAGPAVTLLDAGSSTARFTPPFVTPTQGSITLTFELTVTDPFGATGVDSVNVLVKHANRRPVADAGPNQTVPESSTVQLDGSGSFDPDDDTISFAWVQTAGTLVTLSDASAAQPTFTAPNVGPAGETLRFELTVTDAPNDLFCGAALSSLPQAVEINVQYVNQPPVIENAPPITVNEGQEVSLEVVATDPDGNPLSYTWVQLSGPSVVLDLTDPASPSFVAPPVPCAGEVLTFKVRIDDGFGGTAEATLTVNVLNLNNAPVADAGANQSVSEGVVVTLNAGASSDPDGEGLSYNWTQISGLAVVLSGGGSTMPTFVAPLVTAGGDPNASQVLTFEVTVEDTCGGLATDLVEVTVSNTDHAPVARAGGSQTRCEGAVVTLDGTGSSDPDGDALSYSWTQVAGPAVSLTGADSATAQFVAPMVGAGGDTLIFELTVSDPFGGTATDTTTIAILNCNTPPDCSKAKPSESVLWPPNHRLELITIRGVRDRDGDATITITAVTQDEPTNGEGDGDTAIDAVIRDDKVLIRAERSGRGNGRVYHIHFTATDAEGSCSGVVKVSVPHSKKSRPAIDDGQLYDSTRRTRPSDDPCD